MNTTLKNSLPYLLILLGILILFLIELGPAAGVCLLLGIVMIFESVWPEKWETDKQQRFEKN